MPDLNLIRLLLLQQSEHLKYHGGAKIADLKDENLEALEKGLENLDAHIENMANFGLKPIVGINKFLSDTEAEVEMIEKHCAAHRELQ